MVTEASIADLDTEIITIDPRKLKLLDLNARFMKAEQYQRLVTNVRRDGKLTSVPFACVDSLYQEGDPIICDDDGMPVYEVLSGNHRTQAAIDADLHEINLMVTHTPLDRPRRTAIQLSHNAIEGEDDPAILKQLYESLDVDWKAYSGLDDKTLELLAEVQAGGLGNVDLDYQILSFVFLPHEVERVKEVFEAAKTMVKGSDLVMLARWSEYDRLLDALDETGHAYNAKNTATQLLLVLEVFERHLDDLRAGWDGGERPKHPNLVPLSSIFGTGKVPAKVALSVRRAIDAMIANQTVTSETPWTALELWADRQLGKVGADGT